jgi:hypothetical protein
MRTRADVDVLIAPHSGKMAVDYLLGGADRRDPTVAPLYADPSAAGLHSAWRP